MTQKYAQQYSGRPKVSNYTVAKYVGNLIDSINKQLKDALSINQFIEPSYIYHPSMGFV